VTHAEDTNRVAAATLLFDEGVRALDAGRLEEACTKLAKSQELAPSGGTLLALGECNERSGRFASAWVAYRSAAARAAAAGKGDAEQAALDHASQLEPKLARLTLKVASPAPNLEILRDNGAVTSSEIGIPVPVDPGIHQIKASAPGLRAWSKQLTIASGTSVTVDVPALEPATPDKPPPPPEDTSDGKTQRIVGIAVAGVGAAAVIGGSIFGLLAKSANDDGEATCHGVNKKLCSPAGIESIDTANTRATVATVLFIAGGVLVAGGAVLFFTAPNGGRKQSSNQPSNTPSFDPTTGTVHW
jgi:hypothetical protein